MRAAPECDEFARPPAELPDVQHAADLQQAEHLQRQLPLLALLLGLHGSSRHEASQAQRALSLREEPRAPCALSLREALPARRAPRP